MSCFYEIFWALGHLLPFSRFGLKDMRPTCLFAEFIVSNLRRGKENNLMTRLIDIGLLCA